MLSVDQKIELSQLEVKIEKGLRSFREAGQALLLIKEQKLYSQATFEDYCRERWDIKKSHAYRLIGAFKVLEDLSPVGEVPLPISERQIRPIAKLLPEQRQPAWEAAVAVAEKPAPTTLEIEAAVVAMQTAPGAWQPLQETTVITTGELLTVVSADPKKPLVICKNAAGDERTYLTTQLSGHTTPTPVTINRTEKPSSSAQKYREQAEATLQVESERLKLVEAAAAKLATATHQLLQLSELLVLRDKAPFQNTLSALNAVRKLLGLSPD
jgi:hypothetical protein